MRSIWSSSVINTSTMIWLFNVTVLSSLPTSVKRERCHSELHRNWTSVSKGAYRKNTVERCLAVCLAHAGIVSKRLNLDLESLPVNKTKFLRPRPPEVNKNTWWIWLLSKWTPLLTSTVVMFQAQNRETMNSIWKVAVSFKIIMTTSVTRPRFTTQHMASESRILFSFSCISEEKWSLSSFNCIIFCCTT